MTDVQTMTINYHIEKGDNSDMNSMLVCRYRYIGFLIASGVNIADEWSIYLAISLHS